MEDKRKYKAWREHNHRNPQKAHFTSKFVVVTKNGGYALLRLVSMLVTVVTE